MGQPKRTCRVYDHTQPDRGMQQPTWCITRTCMCRGTACCIPFLHNTGSENSAGAFKDLIRLVSCDSIRACVPTIAKPSIGPVIVGATCGHFRLLCCASTHNHLIPTRQIVTHVWVRFCVRGAARGYYAVVTTTGAQCCQLQQPWHNLASDTTRLLTKRVSLSPAR